MFICQQSYNTPSPMERLFQRELALSRSRPCYRRRNFTNAFYDDDFGFDLSPISFRPKSPRMFQMQRNLIRKPEIIDPKNIKITVDQKQNTMKIDYERNSNSKDKNGEHSHSGQSFYKMTEIKTLPKFINEQNLYKDIKCTFEKGQLKIVLPEDKNLKALESKERDGKDVDMTENAGHDDKHVETEKQTVEVNQDKGSESSLIDIETVVE